MASTIHSNARTTPRIRQELPEAPAGVSDPELARRYGISRMTVRKWRRRRTEVEDRTHRPKTMHTRLTAEQETMGKRVKV
ncbi:helix-turn-helix domain-containing protein [Thioalkalivibrio sp. ALE11]|uniref:helix-turn-helix domain-containing protein n=1 Tax=Thioalkalivibrio sp. ALE11 TaxID=1265494 RepID=UPI0003A26564